ncbi:hypothetical protein GCM10027089_31920 [Nocardia thraciensis]
MVVAAPAISRNGAQFSLTAFDSAAAFCEEVAAAEDDAISVRNADASAWFTVAVPWIELEHPATTSPVPTATVAHANPNPRGFSSFIVLPASRSLGGGSSGGVRGARRGGTGIAVAWRTVLDFRLT